MARQDQDAGISLRHSDGGDLLRTPVQSSRYCVVSIPQGSGTFYSDFGSFAFEGPVLLFATPMQHIYIEGAEKLAYEVLQFHSDFYCIEYHREEVACNGLLFNNIYLEPTIGLDAVDYDSFGMILSQIRDELSAVSPSDIVLKALLQLFLARCSQAKNRELANSPSSSRDEVMEKFRQLLEVHFLTLHKPSDYAGMLFIPSNTFTKRCVKYFRKTPSNLITERLVLEAKKQLHLTRKSIKEIAYALNFQDEFYFSRFFKKHTSVSPQGFRDRTGISIVADLYR